MRRYGGNVSPAKLEKAKRSTNEHQWARITGTAEITSFTYQSQSRKRGDRHYVLGALVRSLDQIGLAFPRKRGRDVIIREPVSHVVLSDLYRGKLQSGCDCPFVAHVH